jgi:DNA-binding transcriptional ArsR family regulator
VGGTAVVAADLPRRRDASRTVRFIYPDYHVPKGQKVYKLTATFERRRRGARDRMSTTTPTGGDETGPSVDATPSRDELFHVLRNRRRRFAIHYLEHHTEPVDVGDLATQVAAWENEVAVEEVTSAQRRRVYNALQQTHIPELEDTGIVETERREVELSDYAEDLDIYMEVVPGEDIPWSEYYLGLGAVGTAAIAVTWLDVGPFAAVPDATVGLFLAVALVVSALANYFLQHPSLVGDGADPPEVRDRG